jgi:protein ImuB
MPRILSVWLPHWPILRLRLTAAPDRPVVTVETIHGVRRLAAVGPDAAAQGLLPGQTLADARALCPGLIAHDADPEADAAALASLAGWCERYTPLAAADFPDGLWLDITGCAHLLGGEAALARDLRARLVRNSLACRLAIAGTAGAAWALAHASAGDGCVVLPPGRERDALGGLPVGLLRLDPATEAGLRRLGLRRIGDLLRIPRGEIAKRFAGLPLLRLDQALGAAAEAITWPRPPAPFAERLDFAEPIGSAEDLARALDMLAARLCAHLERQQQGAHRLVAGFFRIDNAIQRLAVATALPSREAAYLTKLLRAKLEGVDPGFGIKTIVLEAEETAPLATPQAGFAEIAASQGVARLAATVDRLANRLGQDRVWRLAPRASHVPERAVRPAPPLAGAPAWSSDPSAPRPIRLLRAPEPIEATAPVPDDPPILFRWRRRLHRVRAAAGPERIAAEWWLKGPSEDIPETDLIRDYYQVEDTEGARFWLFRTGMHGGGRTPSWYLHGLFA